MDAKVVLQLTGPMDHLRLVWQTGETLLEPVTFEEDNEGNRYNVLLALQEMVTNVLRHSYDLDESLPIEVEFEVSAQQLVIELRDRGEEFNPLEFDSDAAESEEMPTSAGGFGIHIAKMVMDEVEYERRGDWNCLRLTKDVLSRAKV